uniref:Rho guanine nucleotide exchange factor 11-like n=1 Tax=Sinocyclocheilus rhinocerous TaxID=307959 RepID=A0A673H677_9TELE
MSVRHPTSTLDRLSSLTLGDSERRSSPGQQRETLSDLPSDNAGTGLVQRCVVVQRDNLGFGFTVCGERIKLVQNVRPGGAAVKAGVQEGDRIIKVNGSLVSSMSHQEVVKMIKSGTYVALTLQGPPPSVVSVPLQPLPSDLLPNHRTAPGEAPPPPPTPPTGSSTPTQRITGPKPLQDPEVQKHATEILRKMLEQEEAELQNLLEEQSRNPSPSLEERIESAKRRANQVRVKIRQDVDGTRSEAVASYLTAGEGRLSMDSSEGDVEACESPFSSPSTFPRNPLLRRQGSDTHPSDSGGKTQIIGPEEEEEDDGYSINEMDGPFQDIELLKSRPAHMTVFMRYVFSQLLDPNPLLFYLSVEAYLGSSPKDARSLAPQICSHFLDHDAPVKIKVREEFLTDIESRLHAQEDIRGPLSELQQQVLPDIQEQLQDYRSKQTMGLGSLFGESDLQQLDGDPVKERQVVDKQVLALWDVLSKHEEDRSSPLASAVHLYLRHSGIKLRDSKVFPGLMSEKEKWLPFFPKAKKLSSARREKDGDDKKRNPILKYIGKPRSTSQSSKHAHTHTHTHSLSHTHTVISSPTFTHNILVNTPQTRFVWRLMLCWWSAELFTTEASHLRTLRVLDQVFYQKMQSVLSPEELSCIFLNLRLVYELHASLCEAMKKRRESPVVQGIGDIMLARLEGEAGDQFEEQVSHLCSQQSQALELIKSKRRKDPRFAHLIQECEASPHCRRLQLKDLLVAEMQRLTKYPLLLDNVIKHTETASPDLQLLQRAQARCRGILQAVNEVVRETEHRHRLGQYQRRLDLTPLERLAKPNLDLTTKRMIHEGPLTWKVSKDKAIEVQALLLSDLLVLLQRAADERLLLRCPSRSLGAAPDLKIPFCPILRLDSALVRLVATDNKALYVISTSESQIYELVAGTSSEKNTWKDLLEKTIAAATQGAGSSKQGSPVPDDESALTLTDGSDARRHQDRVGSLRTKAAVAEAALQDVETLRQLIFRDLEDGWSQDSDDTPTNETANERSPLTDGAGAEFSDPAPSERPSQWGEESVEAPPVEALQSPVQVVRKGYETSTDELKDSDASHNIQQTPDMSFISEEEEQETPCLSPTDQSLTETLSHRERLGQSQPSVQRHVIKNVDEIFSTMEELMRKLQHLRDIEADHYTLLKKLRKPLPVDKISSDLVYKPPTAVRMPSLDRGAGDGKEGVSTEPAQPEIQSTGF